MTSPAGGPPFTWGGGCTVQGGGHWAGNGGRGGWGTFLIVHAAIVFIVWSLGGGVGGVLSSLLVHISFHLFSLHVFHIHVIIHHLLLVHFALHLSSVADIVVVFSDHAGTARRDRGRRLITHWGVLATASFILYRGASSTPWIFFVDFHV